MLSATGEHCTPRQARTRRYRGGRRIPGLWSLWAVRAAEASLDESQTEVSSLVVTTRGDEGAPGRERRRVHRVSVFLEYL